MEEIYKAAILKAADRAAMWAAFSNDHEYAITYFTRVVTYIGKRRDRAYREYYRETHQPICKGCGAYLGIDGHRRECENYTEEPDYE